MSLEKAKTKLDFVVAVNQLAIAHQLTSDEVFDTLLTIIATQTVGAGVTDEEALTVFLEKITELREAWPRLLKDVKPHSSTPVKPSP
jgi:xanthine dehydrogenase iron-sulfur cluster and FAD-binding subunit A